MNDNTNKAASSAGGGLGFCSALTIAFIVLKLCKVINWSWLWVLAPMWISIAFSLFLILIMLIIGIIGKIWRG
jgi:hypothetical protein